MDVALIAWPADKAKRKLLAADRKPRLLLVAVGTAPPLIEDPLEDWVRLPADRTEVRARVTALTLRMVEWTTEAPTIEDSGLLRYRDAIVQLPPIEARITQTLVESFGNVVAPDDLLRGVWPDETTSRNTLDVHISRLRRRLKNTGLHIRTIRSRGYLLEPS